MSDNSISPMGSNKNSGLHFGHLGLVLACAAFLLLTSWMKSGFHFDIFSSQSTDNAQVLSYDQAKAQVLAENDPIIGPSSSDQDLSTQLAMVDPSSGGGSVLGTSTDGSNLFPSADEMITQPMLDAIKIKVIATTSVEAIKDYSDRLTFAESQFNIIGMLSDLNSQDPVALKNVETNSKQLVALLAIIPVPKELVTYHKIKMMYYNTFSFMAQAFSGETKNPDMEGLSNILFSLSEKIDSIENNILTEYNVQL